MTTPTSVNDADVFADGPSPLNVVVVFVRSVVACTCTRSLFQYIYVMQSPMLFTLLQS